MLRNQLRRQENVVNKGEQIMRPVDEEELKWRRRSDSTLVS